MTSLLKMFEENPIYNTRGRELEQRIIIFSPTALSETNVVFKNLKNLPTDDIYLEYTDDILEDILIEIKQHIDEVNEYEKYLKVLNKFEKKRPRINRI
jgi:histone deacetylase complex regulatory component SIN3